MRVQRPYLVHGLCQAMSCTTQHERVWQSRLSPTRVVSAHLVPQLQHQRFGVCLAAGHRVIPGCVRRLIALTRVELFQHFLQLDVRELQLGLVLCERKSGTLKAGSHITFDLRSCSTFVCCPSNASSRALTLLSWSVNTFTSFSEIKKRGHVRRVTNWQTHTHTHTHTHTSLTSFLKIAPREFELVIKLVYARAGPQLLCQLGQLLFVAPLFRPFRVQLRMVFTNSLSLLFCEK